MKLVTSYSKNADCPEVKEDSFFVFIGKSTYQLSRDLYVILTFIGETFVSLLQLLRHPSKLRVKELTVQLEATGINAIPIVALVTFLIGVVVAYLTAEQIEKFGANILIVDAISVAMCRELSPVLVAIIVAGRSGSAFTAQLGAMKLNEEVDAISVLGLSPMQVLILPRVIALMLVMPILVFVGDISGIVGGMLIGEFYLGLSGATFLQRLQSVLAIKHVFIGLVKAPVFAYFVSVIGCHLGLQVAGSAKDLGEMTTSTVVKSIVLVILLNAIFAIIFHQMGI